MAIPDKFNNLVDYIEDGGKQATALLTLAHGHTATGGQPLLTKAEIAALNQVCAYLVAAIDALDALDPALATRK